MGLPATTNYSDMAKDEQARAKVVYYCRATIRVHNGEIPMVHKYVVNVAEPSIGLKMNEQITDEVNINTDCIRSNGIGSITVNFEKNIYEPTEVIRAMVLADNSRSDAKVKCVQYKVVQRVHLNNGTFQANIVNEMLSGEIPGPNAKEGGLMTEILMDLTKCKYEISKDLQKKKSQGFITPEERAQLKMIKPGTCSAMCKNEYSVEVKLVYPDVMGMPVPTIRFPFRIQSLSILTN